MSKLFGVELKNVKEFEGREWPGFTASIYMDGKRVGIAADYGDGDSININLDNDALKKELDERAEKYFAKYPEYKWSSTAKDFIISEQYEMPNPFLEKILEFNKVQKYYTGTCVKKGFPVLIYCFNKDNSTLCLSTHLTAYPDDDMMSYKELAAMEKFKKESGCKHPDCKTFKSIDDFTID